MTTKPMVVAIASVSGGGKTTITRELRCGMQNTEALYFDDYDYDMMSGIADICKWVEDDPPVKLHPTDADVSPMRQECAGAGLN